MKRSQLKQPLLTASRTILGTALAALCFASTANAADKYVFYLHGKGIDDGGSTGGYESNVSALKELGYNVVSEPRKSGMIRKPPEDLENYAKDTAQEITKLISSGVPASDITVMGYSRGGVLTLLTSSYLNNDQVNYVVLAGCVASDGPYKRATNWQLKHAKGLKGNFLSIYEASDDGFASCDKVFSAGSVKQQEVKLDTGKGHKLFYEADDSWMNSFNEWANR